jgi:hypothetical protein
VVLRHAMVGSGARARNCPRTPLFSDCPRARRCPRAESMAPVLATHEMESVRPGVSVRLAPLLGRRAGAVVGPVFLASAASDVAATVHGCLPVLSVSERSVGHESMALPALSTVRCFERMTPGLACARALLPGEGALAGGRRP